MSEACTESIDRDRGAQVDFIGIRKRAMHRACKRIPSDPRVIKFKANEATGQMINSMAEQMYDQFWDNLVQPTQLWSMLSNEDKTVKIMPMITGDKKDE